MPETLITNDIKCENKFDKILDTVISNNIKIETDEIPQLIKLINNYNNELEIKKLNETKYIFI